jgi:hypothetical protein
MLALALTLVLALYIFGPDAFSRFLLDFSVPRRNLSLTKSEEVYRAVIWSGVSWAVAYLWARWWGTLARLWDWAQLRIFFSGLVSDEYFRKNSDAWFHSLHCTVWMNFCILWRVYVVVFLMVLLLHARIRYYANIRDWLSGEAFLKRWGHRVLAAIVPPRIAPWHVLLSQILIRDKTIELHVDVMTKMNILYQGRLADKTLGPDGSLVSITLADPQRFVRPAYLDAKKADPKTDRLQFWKPIPTNMFIIMGSEIHSMNLRYVPQVKALKRDQHRDSDFRKELEAVNDLVRLARQRAGRNHP